MRCGRIRKRLMAYHDGELGGAWSRRIEKHILSCAVCEQALEGLEAVDQTIAMPVPESEYWSGFTARIMDRVKDEPVGDPVQTKAAESRLSYKVMRLAPAFSIALVVVVAAGLLMEIRGPVVPRQSVPTVRKQAVEADSMANMTRPEQIDEAAMMAEPEPVLSSEGTDVSRTYHRDYKGSSLRKKETFSRDDRYDEEPLRALMFKAETLSREGKQEESEKVLRDLLSQLPPPPIQERATMLLVQVLWYQDRIGEARQLLTESQAAFPDNDMVQEFKLETAPADVKTLQ